jgi:NAD dependent epimerase/dehydratase
MKTSLQNQTCVVTGAGGFIGSHLVEELLRRGAAVRALTHYNAMASIGNLAAFDPELLASPNLKIIAGDVRDARCVRELVAGAQVVFHLAALIGIPYSYVAPESYVETNIKGTLNILEACRDARIPRILHTSTSEVYGTARHVPMDERHPLQGQSPYSASKIGADKLAEAYALSFDLPVTTVRPFNTYGPRQSLRAIIPAALSQAMSDKAEEIRLGALDPVRDLTFVSDTVNAFCDIAEAPLETVRGRLYNLGTGIGISIGELVKKIQSVVGSSKSVVEEHERFRPEPSEVRELVSDPSRIHREVGWKAQVSLEEGLKQTAEWMIKNSTGESKKSEYRV